MGSEMTGDSCGCGSGGVLGSGGVENAVGVVSSGVGGTGATGSEDGVDKEPAVGLGRVGDGDVVAVNELGSSLSGRAGSARLQGGEVLVYRGGASWTWTRFRLICLLPVSMR